MEEIKEARIQTGYHECTKGARVARRGLKIGGNVKYQCIKSMAELELNIDGSLSIKKLNTRIIKIFCFISLYRKVWYEPGGILI